MASLSAAMRALVMLRDTLKPLNSVTDAVSPILGPKLLVLSKSPGE